MSTNMSKGNHQPLSTISSLLLLKNSWLGLAQVLGREPVEIAEGHLEDLGVTQQSMEYCQKIFKKRLDRWNYIFEDHSGNCVNDTCEVDTIEKQGAYLGSC